MRTPQRPENPSRRDLFGRERTSPDTSAKFAEQTKALANQPGARTGKVWGGSLPSTQAYPKQHSAFGKMLLTASKIRKTASFFAEQIWTFLPNKCSLSLFGKGLGQKWPRNLEFVAGPSG